MTITEVLTIILALYGALLSSYLGYRELGKERHKLKIILKELRWNDLYQLEIVNSGYRPITVIGVNIEENLYPPGPQHVGAFFDSRNDSNDHHDLPIKLEEGEFAIFVLSDYFADMYRRTPKQLEITVIDSEGHCYKRYSKWVHDAKYGGTYPLEDRMSFMRWINYKWQEFRYSRRRNK